VSTLAMGGFMPAVAQSSNKAAAAAPEEIIVTARKREESIMKTPVILDAISQKQIQNMHIENVQSINSVSPGTFIQYGFAESGIYAFIRGVGSVGGNFVDQSVGLNVDG